MGNLSHLDELEAEAIYIIREVAAECENPVMLYSIGKDSSVMLHLAMKAFYPEKPPFPFLHIDTTWKFKEMIQFRDHIAEKMGIEMLVYTNEEGVKAGINPFDHGSAYTDIMKTQALKQALNKYQFTAAFGGGYSFQKQHEEVTSQSESITVTFEANDTADYRAIALYSVPILTRCDLEYLSPTRRQSVRMPIFSYTYMTRQSIKQVEVPLDLEPFRIDNPSKLGDWEAREILTMTASEPNVSKSVNFSLNSERIDMTLETSGKIS